MIHPSFLFKMWGLVAERDMGCRAWLGRWSGWSQCPASGPTQPPCVWAGSQKCSLNWIKTVKYSADSAVELRKSLFVILLWWCIDLKTWQIHFIDLKMYLCGCKDIWVPGYQPRYLLIRLQQISGGQDPRVKMDIFVFLFYWMDILFLTSHQLFFMSQTGVFCKPILLQAAFLHQVAMQQRVWATGLCHLTSLGQTW